MDSDVRRIVERLTQEGNKTRDFFRDLSAVDLDQVVYTEGAAWKVKDLLAHLAATEATMLGLLKNVLAGGAGIPEDFDLDSFNEAQVSQRSDLSPQDLLDRFLTDRQALVQVVVKLRESDLARRGRHPWLGWTTVGEVLQLVYRHSMLHLRDARRALVSRQPVPPTGARPRAAPRLE